jgi:uncharacterized protein (DUF736 family)
MTAIATLTKTASGYTGSLHTLTLNTPISLVPTKDAKGKAPEFQVMADSSVEIGGAWRRQGKNGNDYLSVRLDDPSFPAPIYANLVERNEHHLLIWKR